MNRYLWGLPVFLFSMVALSVYLIVRKPLPRVPKVHIESLTAMKLATPMPRRKNQTQAFNTPILFSPQLTGCASPNQ